MKALNAVKTSLLTTKGKVIKVYRAKIIAWVSVNLLLIAPAPFAFAQGYDICRLTILSEQIPLLLYDPDAYYRMVEEVDCETEHQPRYKCKGCDRYDFLPKTIYECNHVGGPPAPCLSNACIINKFGTLYTCGPLREEGTIEDCGVSRNSRIPWAIQELRLMVGCTYDAQYYDWKEFLSVYWGCGSCRRFSVQWRCAIMDWNVQDRCKRGKLLDQSERKPGFECGCRQQPEEPGTIDPSEHQETVPEH